MHCSLPIRPFGLFGLGYGYGQPCGAGTIKSTIASTCPILSDCFVKANGIAYPAKWAWGWCLQAALKCGFEAFRSAGQVWGGSEVRVTRIPGLRRDNLCNKCSCSRNTLNKSWLKDLVLRCLSVHTWQRLFNICANLLHGHNCIRTSGTRLQLILQDGHRIGMILRDSDSCPQLKLIPAGMAGRELRH